MVGWNFYRMSDSSVGGNVFVDKKRSEENGQIGWSCQEGHSNSYNHSLQAGWAEKHPSIHETLNILMDGLQQQKTTLCPTFVFHSHLIFLYLLLKVSFELRRFLVHDNHQYATDVVNKVWVERHCNILSVWPETKNIYVNQMQETSLSLFLFFI